ncbi:MAG: type II toxin-antitoxin system VapB family antitoxin [Acidobacteriaceae bacterium]|jgi:Arc/MetJ family transcription regulator
MRTNIDINDKLLKKAMRHARTRTKKETVDHALKFFVKVKDQEGLKDLWGKVEWEGNLDESRLGRNVD